jgi:hypothetical protein
MENPCRVREHKTCWKSHLPEDEDFAEHHKMVNPNAQIIIGAVTRSEEDQARQQRLHEQDRNARWFSVKWSSSGTDHVHRNYTGQGVPVLYAYDRFRQLCDPDVTGNAETTNHYPRFVSFIGDTCVGKSSLVRAMILMGLAERAGVVSGDDWADQSNVSRLVAAIGTRTTEWPVTRSANSDSLTNPTTQGVHLYRDEGTAVSSQDSGKSAPTKCPILFVDCEGFNAGEALTDAQKHSDDEAENRGRLNVSSHGGRHRSVSRADVPDYHHRITASCYGRRGKDGIDLFYARFLYAISDVLVFVTKDDTKLLPQLRAVLEWASAAVYKSINHASRKTLIIVRHKSELHKAELYQEGKLASQFLDGHPPLWTVSDILKDFVTKYNRSEPVFTKRIMTNQRLYEILFRRIICWYVPNKDNPKVSPARLVRQWTGLRNHIESAVRDEEMIVSAANMKYNVPELSRVLGKAFEHFTTSEDPFDFYLAAQRDNPSPVSMEGHIGNFLRHAYGYKNNHGSQLGDPDKMITDVVVASLLTWTTRRFQHGKFPGDICGR